MATKVYKRSTSYASLVSLVGQNNAASDQFATSDSGGNRIVVNFPSMPESLELTRVASYENLLQSAIAPNGLHFYRWTEPLKIPLKFSLSSQDEDYCGTDGPYALLRLAANLHALTMPILADTSKAVTNLNAAPNTAANAGSLNPVVNNPFASTPATPFSINTNLVSSAPDVSGLSNQTGQPTGGQMGEPAAIATARNSVINDITNYDNFYFPPACLLSITLASGVPGQSTLGVFVVGFVERVTTTLRGPWLQGSFDQTTNLRNLPSFIDCEFTFVSQPGYTNNFKGYNIQGGANLYTTTAKDVYQNFYNDVTGLSQSPLGPGIGINGPSASPTGN